MQREVENFREEHESDRDAVFREAWEHLNVPREARILEIAAGDLRTAARLWHDGYRPVCLEPIPEILGRGEFDRETSIPRVCGSATRLPFRAGSFDVVFCQAALHHLDAIEPVVREAARVLRRGGMFLAAAEPYSACGSSIERIRGHLRDLSFDMGLNERIPRFGDYVAALRGAGLEEVRSFTRAGDVRVPRRLGWASGLLARAGVARGMRMRVRHALTHGQSSLVARRGGASIAAPVPVRPAEYCFDPADYIERRARAGLVGIWKALMDATEVPTAIEVGRNDLFELRRGFEPLQRDASEIAFRWLIARGAFFLRVEAGARELVADVCLPPGGPAGCDIEAWAEGDSLGVRQLAAGNDWTELRWQLRPGGEMRIVEFRLVCEALRPLGGGRFGSVKVRRVGAY
ncbi:MAG: class I SAM-dependent methyltransferase [Candidatus Sumerlaeia bacterium]|nr:class I SAM-dependent methyltransferase [Candidatus Sumerlaeia bacterium]